MTFSRLLFYLEAVRLPPSYLPSREFSASSDSDFIRFPRDSIFAGNTLTGLDVSVYTPFVLCSLQLNFKANITPFSNFYVHTLTPLFQCLDIHYIELFDERLLLEPTLSSKVCTEKL